VPAPWVAQHQDRVGFALQAFPIDTPTDKGRHLLAAGRLAEALGFDGFFVSDHPGWALDPWPHLGALAVTTERIRLGLNVGCALYRHPVLTARLAADVDNLSGGRLVLGLGCGWDANEFANLGLPIPPAPERQAALGEALAIVRGVWGDAPFSFEGRHFRCANARVAPPPRQRPHPPLMIAGGGERTTLRQVAEHADAGNLFQVDLAAGRGTTPEDVRRKLAVLRSHCDALGRPFETVLRTYGSGWTILAEDEGALRAKLEHYFPEGLERRYNGPWRDFVFAGTPERATAHFAELIDAGVQYVIVETLDAADQETIRLLAERVVPRLSG
jgi:alkanesulfonate monooxygenase SsuD/methylene tetrahydromethanopterin reductase-like flavin-dependent oxidoreductase (luciferase family)